MVITKKEIINSIAKIEDIPVSTVEAVYDGLEKYIFEKLHLTTPLRKVVIRMFSGMSIECRHQKRKEMVHPKTGKSFKPEDRIWAKASITRYYNQRLNNYF